MESLANLLAFTRTAESLSFVQAARRLGLSASAVGKSVARLEQDLGVQLLHRSTRKVSLTTEGALFYDRTRRILDDIEDAEMMLKEAVAAPRGRLRVSLPTIGYRFLAPQLPAFARRYPEVELDFDFNDHLIDVVAEGVDVVIRSGVLPDSQLMSRRLGAFRFLLCAAPAYLEARGELRSAADLDQHACLRFRFPTTGKLQDWVLRGASRDAVARYPTAMVCNNMEAMLAAAIAGLGVAYVPDFLATEALSKNLLRQLLETETDAGGDFWLLWPSTRQASPKVRAFVEFMAPRLFKGQRT
jgi:DNA-binding transcriptional LysR family regulator